MIRLPNDFREFLQLLSSHGVEYLIIGGYAVGYHGHPRATGDMDIWIATHPDNAAKLVAVLRDFGFADSSLTADLFLEENRTIRMGVPPLRIELITTISGVAFAECYARRVTAESDSVHINFISRDDLKVNKKAAGRLKDLTDLESLP